jgi:hypothetical protein
MWPKEMQLLLLVALAVNTTAAALRVQLQPLTSQSTAQDTSHAVGCKFQVVVGSKQEWSNAMQVCIWIVASSHVLDAVPAGAQCTHGVVGNAMFAVTAHGTYSISAAVVHDEASDSKQATMLSGVATIVVATNSNAPAVTMRTIQVQHPAATLVACWWKAAVSDS